MDARIQCLARNRDAITRYLATIRTGAVNSRAPISIT